MSDFLGQITYREAWLSLEALDSGELPPFAGSMLRGALGHLLRPLLCESSGCGHDCQRPQTCRYFSLFERSRAPDGRNLPKPMILEAPAIADLKDIAAGGPIRLPLRTSSPRAGEKLPALTHEKGLQVARGDELRACIRLLGSSAMALAGIIETIGRHGLDLGGVRLLLRSASDPTGRLLYDRRLPSVPAQTPAVMRIPVEREPARRIRIVFETPAILKVGRTICFDPVDLAARFFEHAMARALQVHSLMDGDRLPWLEAPAVRSRISGHRLFHYVLPRRSYRQNQWLDFDGVVGHLDLEGNFEAGMPYARAAEILHFGQKATFGLGSVKVLVLA